MLVIALPQWTAPRKETIRAPYATCIRSKDMGKVRLDAVYPDRYLVRSKSEHAVLPTCPEATSSTGKSRYVAANGLRARNGIAPRKCVCFCQLVQALS